MSAPALDALALRHPVLLAPLSGGPSTPELVAAVAAAGGFGWLGASYLTPDGIRSACRRTRELTGRPFGVNLFAGGWSTAPAAAPARALALLAPFHARLGLPPPVAPVPSPDPFPGQLAAVLEERPAAFGFTFGIPPAEALAALRARGIATFGTATSAHEATLLAEAGVDAVVAQGTEAGGNRGSFAGERDARPTPTLALVAELRRAVALPVIASGGIMDGRDAARALRAGAAAAQLGTAFLACPESGASAPYKAALLAARGGDDPTVLTRAFSGRWARGIANAVTRAAEADPAAVLPYPLQNALTRPMRQAAAAAGDAELLSLWAGTGVGRLRVMPAGDLVRTIAAELEAAA